MDHAASDYAALKNRSFHDDVVLRIIFVGMNELLNAFVNRYANPDSPAFFFLLVITPTLFLLVYYSFIKQTAFVQDVREIFIYDFLFRFINISFYIVAHDTLYQAFKPIYAISTSVIYVALWLRIFWPCRQKEPENYQNWPLFGPLALWQRRRNPSWQVCPATGHQAVAAYAGIVACFVVGYWLWLNEIKNVDVFMYIGVFTTLAFVGITAPARAKCWWQAHLADRAAKEAARQAADAAKEATRQAADAAREAAQHAADAAAQEAEQARRIIAQQAQQSLEIEAARIAAEHHAELVQAEAMQLREQLANPPQAEPPPLPPPDPALAMLDPEQESFDAGLYLTMLAIQERSKYIGKSKEHAKDCIFETLAPVAMKLGVKSKWRIKRDQPNRKQLENCIMAGLVGFEEESKAASQKQSA